MPTIHFCFIEDNGTFFQITYFFIFIRLSLSMCVYVCALITHMYVNTYMYI